MDNYKYLIIKDGTDNTNSVEYCKKDGEHYLLKYHENEIIYRPYKDKIIFRETLKLCKPEEVRITYSGEVLFGIEIILNFGDYIKIIYDSGYSRFFKRSEIEMINTIPLQKDEKSVFNYFRELAEIIGIKNDEDRSILTTQYNKITTIGADTVLATYLFPEKKRIEKKYDKALFYPFGCNLSQMTAVERAMKNRISIIEGPPGTGKTQTILNIIANIVMNHQTVAVVSNNNNATDNVIEKLEKNDFDFISARLGKSQNKDDFIAKGQKDYPDFSKWKMARTEVNREKQIVNVIQNDIKESLEMRNNLSLLKQKLSSLEIEKRYFEDYFDEVNISLIQLKPGRKINATKLMKLWIEMQTLLEKRAYLSFLLKIKYVFIYKYFNTKLFFRRISEILPLIQLEYYKLYEEEIKSEIMSLEEKLKRANFEARIKGLQEKSKKIFCNELANRYAKTERRIKYAKDENVFWRRYNDFLKEYPVITSSTHSIRNCVNESYIYDYIIMDESSQVDVVTGALAISCAKNVVIVGDTKQLPNVLTPHDKKVIQRISDTHGISNEYRYEDGSFLDSVKSVLKEVPITILKEHYRCHPKIIEFCNHKFYNDELVIMTTDKGEKDVLKVYKTRKGNHARERKNQRQIDEIVEEVLPELYPDGNYTNVGIISPYRDQTEAIKDLKLQNIKADTVHKFQGREMKDIIITTVDNEIGDFVDNENMLNVAVSRAIDRLRLVVSDNEKNANTNIGALIHYIEYNNFEIVHGKVFSVFDLLYAVYSEECDEYFKTYKKVSEYNSESLLYHTVNEVLEEENCNGLSIVLHRPLNTIIRDLGNLNDNECKFVMDNRSHVDILVYDKMSKRPVLAIEVDGISYHKKGTRQEKNDKKKDEIFRKCGIELVRFRTDGSGEKEKVRKKILEYKINYQ